MAKGRTGVMELQTRDTAAIIEQVVIQGDLSKLSPADRNQYYLAFCRAAGVNPTTRPFEYLVLNDKMVLYARKDCTDQLRAIHSVSVTITARERMDDVYVVTARASMPGGRTDESIGAVNIAKEEGEWQTAQSGKRFFRGTGKYIPMHGDDLANAFMKAETKAKRRATLSLVGLGILDETEIETIPDARVVPEEAPKIEAPKPAAKRQPSKADYANRYGELFFEAQGCGIKCESINVSELTIEEIAEKGKALAALIEQDKAGML